MEALLKAMGQAGYDLGLAPGADIAAMDGEDIISALKLQEDQRAISGGASGAREGGRGFSPSPLALKHACYPPPPQPWSSGASDLPLSNLSGLGWQQTRCPCRS